MNALTPGSTTVPTALPIEPESSTTSVTGPPQRDLARTNDGTVKSSASISLGGRAAGGEVDVVGATAGAVGVAATVDGHDDAAALSCSSSAPGRSAPRRPSPTPACRRRGRKRGRAASSVVQHDVHRAGLSVDALDALHLPLVADLDVLVLHAGDHVDARGGSPAWSSSTPAGGRWRRTCRSRRRRRGACAGVHGTADGAVSTAGSARSVTSVDVRSAGSQVSIDCSARATLTRPSAPVDRAERHGDRCGDDRDEDAHHRGDDQDFWERHAGVGMTSGSESTKCLSQHCSSPP